MKNIVTLGFLFVMTFAGRVQANDSLTITGRLKGLGNEKVSISFMGADNKKTNLEVYGKNDVFTLRIKKQSEPRFARLATTFAEVLTKKVDGQTYFNPSLQLMLLVYQSNLKVSGAVKDIFLSTVKGDKVNDDYEKLKKPIKPLLKSNWEIMKTLFYIDDKKDSVQYWTTYAKFKANAEKEKQIKEEFVEKNPASYVSLMTLSHLAPNYLLEEFEIRFNKLTNDYKETTLGKQLQKKIDYVAATAAGNSSINFVKKDKDGNEINLSSYKGRYVLLDFWGSWCGACRLTHPHLKEVYEKYKDKGLAVISVSYEKGGGDVPEKQRKNWLDAIEKDGMNWTQILSNDGDGKSDLVKDYRIIAFPTKILLDTEGKILVRVVGRTLDDVDKALERVYGF